MDNEENKIEESLQKRFSHIAPPRELFNKTMEQVTKEGLNRSIILKGDQPSPYQSTYSIFVKKITFIGIPIVALAAYLIIINTGVLTPKNTPTDSPLAVESGEVVNNGSQIVSPPIQITENTNPSLAIDTTSVDTIVDSLIMSADADIALAINDTEEDSAINAELDYYNSVKSNTYEDVL